MKVLCIDAATRVLPTELVEGEIYNVSNSAICTCCFCVQELCTHAHKDRFVLVGDIDETELVKERENVFA